MCLIAYTSPNSPWCFTYLTALKFLHLWFPWPQRSLLSFHPWQSPISPSEALLPSPGRVYHLPLYICTSLSLVKKQQEKKGTNNNNKKRKKKQRKRQHAQNGVAYAKPCITNSRLNYSFHYMQEPSD